MNPQSGTRPVTLQYLCPDHGPFVGQPVHVAAHVPAVLANALPCPSCRKASRRIRLEVSTTPNRTA